MLSLNQLSDRIAGLAADAKSVADFEHWFRVESRDFHLWGDNDLRDVVFAVESVLSEYRFADLDEAGVAGELAKAIRPFGETRKIAWFPRNAVPVEVEGEMNGVLVGDSQKAWRPRPIPVRWPLILAPAV
jgi:hypothetical protein